MTPYISIDIETTGLDPETCQVLEIAAVLDRGLVPIEECPTFRVVLKHDKVFGQPYAMSMHKELLREIALLKVPSPETYSLVDMSTANCICYPGQAVPRFHSWLLAHGVPTDKGFTPAGKNYAGFDKGFLEACVPKWKSDVKIKHRTIDPGSMFWQEDDEFLPDTATCYKRAGLPPEVAHTALEDALGVVRLVRAYWEQKRRDATSFDKRSDFIEAFGYLQASLHPGLLVDVNNPMQMAREIVRHQNAECCGGSM